MAYLHRDKLPGFRDRLLAWRPFSTGAASRPAQPIAPQKPPAAAAAAPAPTDGAPAATPKSEAPSSLPQFEVDLTASKIELVDGRYVVRGEIANRGGSAGAASKLIVTFKKGNEVLETRTYPLALGPIPAGERVGFSQALDNPPAGATDIVPSVE